MWLSTSKMPHQPKAMQQQQRNRQQDNIANPRGSLLQSYDQPFEGDASGPQKQASTGAFMSKDKRSMRRSKAASTPEAEFQGSSWTTSSRSLSQVTGLALVPDSASPDGDAERRGRIRAALHKTQLCRFAGKNRCNRGAACCFAHHPSELRAPPIYDCTKMCPKGARCDSQTCRYAHAGHELRKIRKGPEHPMVSLHKATGEWPAWPKPPDQISVQLEVFDPAEVLDHCTLLEAPPGLEVPSDVGPPHPSRVPRTWLGCTNMSAKNVDSDDELVPAVFDATFTLY